MTKRYRVHGKVTLARLAALLAFIPVLAAVPGGVRAQVGSPVDPPRVGGPPEFYVDAIASRGPGMSMVSRVDVFVELPYPSLKFDNTVNGFTARYGVTVEALAKRGERLTTTPVDTRVWDGTVRVISFSETRDLGKSTLTTQTIELPPGTYQLSVEVEDRNSDQTFVRDLPIEVRDFNRPVAISDLTLLDSYDAGTLSLVPRTEATVGSDESGVSVFFEVYANRPGAFRLRHTVRMLDRDAGVPISGVTRGVTEDIKGTIVDDGTDEEVLAQGRSQHVVNVSLPDTKVGTYELRVAVEDQTGAVLDDTGLRFAVRWTGLTAHIEDLDEAISQLEYFAKKRDISFIREAVDPDERASRFRAFWDRRDPSPGTRRNESMEEYYYRVNIANRRYGGTEDGWKTDRGFVLVRFGEPDHIERKPHSFDYKPYEIWVYQRIGRKFIFIDKTGFGDYQLLVPVWDERTRLY